MYFISVKIKWKMAPESVTNPLNFISMSIKLPEFHLSVHQITWISSQCPSNYLNFISMSIKLPEFHFHVHQITWISSHCPSDTFISKWSCILHLFFSWKCPFHAHSHIKSVNHLPRLQVLWLIWAPPCSFFNNYAVTTYSNKPDDSQRKNVIIDSSNYPRP